MMGHKTGVMKQKMQFCKTGMNYFLKYMHNITDFIIWSNKCSTGKESKGSSFKNVYS